MSKDIRFSIQWLNYNREVFATDTLLRHDLSDAITAATILLRAGRGTAKAAHGVFVVKADSQDTWDMEDARCPDCGSLTNCFGGDDCKAAPAAYRDDDQRLGGYDNPHDDHEQMWSRD